MKILVTGAAGFIGSHLCERLLSEGHSVIGIDNFDDFYDPKIKENNIKKCNEYDTFILHKLDIRGWYWYPLFKDDNIDIIVHLAAKAGVRPSLEDPRGYEETNVKGTLNMLEFAKKYRINKFIFASSSSIYGNNKKVPFSESDNVDFPISPYAATKKAGELLCYTYHNLYNININCLRFFTVYGPRQRPDLAIYKFVDLIDRQEEIPIFGDLTMSRDFTYIDDIIDGIMLSMNNFNGYNIYNLGNSHPIRLDSLINIIQEYFCQKIQFKMLFHQAGDVNQTYADISRSHMILGYNPKIKIEEGIGKFIRWFRENKHGVQLSLKNGIRKIIK